MNCLLYPYFKELSAVVDDISHFNDDIIITELVAPIAWKKNIDKHRNVTFDFISALNEVDGVIIADTPNNQFMYNDLIAKMKAAILNRKKIICCTTLQEIDLAMLKNEAKEYDAKFYYMVPVTNKSYKPCIFCPQDSIIIAIGNMFSELNSIPIMLNLVRRYEKLGYHVTAVSNNMNTTLCDFVQFPTELLHSTLSHEKIIKQLNSFYNELQLLYQPDIIITQIPYGMMKYSDICTEDFGVKAYMIFQAISVDFFILNSPVDNLNISAFKAMSEVFRYRFGFDIDCVGIVDKCVNSADSDEEEHIIYDDIADIEVDEFVHFLSVKSGKQIYCFNIKDKNSYEHVVNYSIKKLSTKGNTNNE